MNIKRVFVLATVIAMTLMFTGCGKEDVQAEPEAQPAVEQSIEDMPEAEAPSSDDTQAGVTSSEDIPEDEEAPDAEDASEDDEEDSEVSDIDYPTLPLPEYHYYGPEDWADYADLVGQYLLKDPDRVSESDLLTYTPIVLKVDESNPKDVKVWGEFWLDGFNLMNTSLISNSGGSYLGVAHIDKTGSSPSVTKMDLVEDGSDFQPSFDRLFTKAGLKKAYQQIQDDRDQYRTQALSDYVNHNGLYITQYQDYGWPPVSMINAPETRDEDQQVYYVGNCGYTVQYDMRQICAFESGDADTFADVNSDEWNDFLIEIYSEDGSDIDSAIANLKPNLFDSSVKLTRTDGETFNGVEGCVRLMSEPPYKDGDKVYVNYLVPRKDYIVVVKISSDYCTDEEKQMATDGIIESFLGRLELK